MMRNLFAIAILTLSSSIAWGQAASDVKCSGCINTGDIAQGAVKTGRIAVGGVTKTQIGDDSVGAEELIDGSVGFDELSSDVANAISGSGSGAAGSFVGFSTTQVAGSTGIKGLSEACIDAYGSGSRVATSEELGNATVFPAGATPRAWLLPVDAGVTLDAPAFCGSSETAVDGAHIRTATFVFGSSPCNNQLVVACSM